MEMCTTCHEMEARVRGPVSGYRVCVPCYKRERKKLPPVPASGVNRRFLPALGARKYKCAICGRPASSWVFDPLDGDMKEKMYLLHDGEIFLETYKFEDYAPCCPRQECLAEFEPGTGLSLRARNLYLEILFARIREGSLTAKQLPEIKPLFP